MRSTDPDEIVLDKTNVLADFVVTSLWKIDLKHLAVWLVLYRYAAFDGRFETSVTQLASLSGMNGEAVRRCLYLLSKEGHISDYSIVGKGNAMSSVTGKLVTITPEAVIIERIGKHHHRLCQMQRETTRSYEDRTDGEDT